MVRGSIFVAYPYSISSDDYRRPFVDLGDAFNVEFVIADERITNKQLLDKVEAMIREARLSLFDITGWNPNVALELGIAVGSNRPYYLLFNPTGEHGDVPADLGGIDRIQYRSYKDLGDGIAKLLLQEFGVPREGAEMASQLETLQGRAAELISQEPGLKINDIATRLGPIPVEMAKVVVRPLVGDSIETTGVKRGTRYYPVGHAGRASRAGVRRGAGPKTG